VLVAAIVPVLLAVAVPEPSAVVAALLPPVSKGAAAAAALLLVVVAVQPVVAAAPAAATTVAVHYVLPLRQLSASAAAGSCGLLFWAAFAVVFAVVAEQQGQELVEREVAVTPGAGQPSW